MKKLLLGTFLLAIAGPAVAADMPLKAAPPMAPIFSWSGCYIGGTAGWYHSKSDFAGIPTGAWTTAPALDVAILTGVSAGSFSKDGFIGGGEVGCNIVADNRFLFGIEFDLSDWRPNSSSAVTVAGPVAATTITATTSVNASWLATFRPRFGVTYDHWLFFVSGGFALSNMTFSQSVFFSATGSTQAGTNTGTIVGWTGGGGIEYAVTNNWSIKGEYLYVDLGHQNLNEFNPAFPTFTQFAFNDIKISIARFGLNYRF
jgi:outer membrane immunogenic protein